MLDRSTNGQITKLYRRCRSSDDLLGSGVYGNEAEYANEFFFDQKVESPRVLRRAERYRLAGRQSESSRTGMVIEVGDSLLFTSINGTRNISSSNCSLGDCLAAKSSEASSMMFVYSGRQDEARKSVIQWSEMPSKNTSNKVEDKINADSQQPVKKSSSSRMKDRVAAFLQNSPIGRRRKKGVDHTVNIDTRMFATMQHTNSLPDVLKADTRRPRSKSSSNLITPNSNSMWTLGSGLSIDRKMSRAGTDASNVSSGSNTSLSGNKVARSKSLARSRNALQEFMQFGEKSSSSNNILSYPKMKGRLKKQSVVETDKSDDEVSSPGSEASPYLSKNRRMKSIDCNQRGKESVIVIQQAPVIASLNESNEDRNNQHVEYKKISTSIKFQNIKIREIADEELRNHLEGQSFIPVLISRLSKVISEAIKKRVEESTGGQFKVIAQVYIGSLTDQGITAVSQCLFQKEVDSFVVVAFRNKKLFGYASVLALDFRSEA